MTEILTYWRYNSAYGSQEDKETRPADPDTQSQGNCYPQGRYGLDHVLPRGWRWQDQARFQEKASLRKNEEEVTK